MRNIAKILKKNNIKTVWCTIYGQSEVFNISESLDYPIYIRPVDKSLEIYDDASFTSFTLDGKLFKTGECVLFPSETERTWDNFSSLTKGDPVMFRELGTFNSKWIFGYYTGENDYIVIKEEDIDITQYIKAEEILSIEEFMLFKLK